MPDPRHTEDLACRGPAPTLSEQVADLCRRVAALEARLADAACAGAASDMARHYELVALRDRQDAADDSLEDLERELKIVAARGVPVGAYEALDPKRRPPEEGPWAAPWRQDR